MGDFSADDLKLINKILEVLKKEDHHPELNSEDPELPSKIYQAVSNGGDPFLTMLWNASSAQFKAASIPLETRFDIIKLKKGTN